MSHLKEIKENYFKHLLEALFISISLLIGSITCLIHAFVPMIFKQTASTIMRKTLSRTEDRYDR